MQLNILGSMLTLTTDEDPAYIARLVDYLQEKILETEKLVKIKDPLKLAIVTSLFLVDDLFKTRSGNGETRLSKEESNEAGFLTERMLKLIDESLKDLSP